MSDTLLILPGDEANPAIRATRTGAGVRAERVDVGAALDALPPGATLVLPGQLVRGLETDLPAKARAAERLSIARFAHEDALATDPAGLHVVVGPGAPAPTAVLDPAVMEALLERCDPARVVADFDALAALPGRALVVDRVVEPGITGHAVDASWAEAGYATPTDTQIAEAAFARLDSGAVLDLRTGPFRRRRNAAQSGPWLRVAAVAVLCAALGLVATGLEARAVSRQAAQLEADARALFQDATGTPAPARLSSLASQSAAGAAASTQFLDLSDILFRAVAATPGTRVERLSFDPRGGELGLRLAYPDFEAASALEQAVADAGGALETGGVRDQNGVFIGDATLREAGS